MDARHIAFGLKATAIAMQAMQGRCGDAQRLDLAMTALDHVRDDAEAAAAVQVFAHTSRIDAVEAGLTLRDFIRGWRREPEPAEGEHDWQRRVDCNG